MPKDWDSKTSRVKSKVQNAAYINNLISEKFAEYERELIKVLNGEKPSSDFFEEKITFTLDKALEMELSRLKKAKKTGTYKNVFEYKGQLQKFFNSETTDLNSINLNWYEDYASFLASEIKLGDKVIKQINVGATAHKKINTIKRVVERYGGKPTPPDVQKFSVSQKKRPIQKWSAADVANFENLQLEEGSLLYMVRDFFLLQIYIRGSRVGALLKAYPEQFEESRYTAANGTGKNNVSCKLIPKAQTIVNRYYKRFERLFPFYSFLSNPKLTDFENDREEYRRKNVATAVVNRNLKKLAFMAGITKKATSHIARHTFSRLAIDVVKNPMQSMDLVGHSSLAVHQIYLNDLRKDDELDQLTDEIFGV